MTDDHRHRIARRIYEAAVVEMGYAAKPWTALWGHERERWLRAADAAVAALTVTEAEAIVQGAT